MKKVSRSKSALKLRGWRAVLDRLSEQTGISFEDVCNYTGSVYNDDGVSFYVKVPRKRSVFIGIGMAYGQSVDVINEWIMTFGGKRRLYIKDINEDLAWIFLVEANRQKGRENISLGGRQNFFKQFDEYQDAVYKAFTSHCDDAVVQKNESEADLLKKMAMLDFGRGIDELSDFVCEHIDAFKTAYIISRSFLDSYVKQILATCETHPRQSSLTSLNSLRGYLDDSMINYLSGDSSTIIVLDKKNHKRTNRVKKVPKGKKQYISMCMALGMTMPDINEYLNIMGYAPLDEYDKDESILIDELIAWEEKHPAQRAYKSKYFNNEDVKLTKEQEWQAVDSMLQLRADLKESYAAKGRDFPFIGK